MRLLFLALLPFAAACGSEPVAEEKPEPWWAKLPDPGSFEGRSSTQFNDYGDIEQKSGQYVELTGILGRINEQHAFLRLGSGLRINIPHFDLFGRGYDWHRFLGKLCSASGILHTYTKDIEGYDGPSLEIETFEPLED